jgi:hypothetical protein
MAQKCYTKLHICETFAPWRRIRAKSDGIARGWAKGTAPNAPDSLPARPAGALFVGGRTDSHIGTSPLGNALSLTTPFRRCRIVASLERPAGQGRPAGDASGASLTRSCPRSSIGPSGASRCGASMAHESGGSRRNATPMLHICATYATLVAHKGEKRWDRKGLGEGRRGASGSAPEPASTK